jgi:broad specificity phosphatase PhoE
MPSILLVRHGQASFGGADYDVLSATGTEQAEVLAQDLARRGVRAERVVSGALARQRDTAGPIGLALDRPVQVDARWDEYDADDILSSHSTTRARQERRPGGDAPQISSREFQDVLEQALLSWIAADEASSAREPWPAFATRVRTALEDVAAGLASGQTAVVCTSGGVLAAVGVALLGVAPATFVRLNRVTVNAGVTRIASGRSGMTLVSFNEQSHLEARNGRSLVTYR